jgi:membrane-associated phospholipid phosphatase
MANFCWNFRQCWPCVSWRCFFNNHLDHDSSLANFYGNTGYILGHPSTLFPIIGFTYTSGYLSQNRKLQHLGLSSFESLLFTLTVVKTSKMLVHRHRPNETQSHSTFDGPRFSLSEKNQSFPSGHSAAIWAVATSIALEYNESSWIKLSSYTVASLVALSRLFDNAHWASDVIAGSALGYSIARYTFFNNQTKDINRVSITPLFYNQTGLAITLPI